MQHKHVQTHAIIYFEIYICTVCNATSNADERHLVKFKKSVRLTFTGVTSQHVRTPSITCSL